MSKTTGHVLMKECETPLHFLSNSASVTAHESSSQSCSDSLHDLLLFALCSRDESAWAEFVRRSQPVIAGTVTKTMRRWAKPLPGLADDLVQDTYVKLFADDAKTLRKFVCHHENALYGFLKVVAFNVVHDHFRCLYSQKRGSGHWEESIEPDGGINRIEEGRRSSEMVLSGGKAARTIAASAGVKSTLDNLVLLQQINTQLKARVSWSTFSRDYSIFWLYYRDGLSAKAISRLPSIRLSVKGVESLLLRLTRLIQVKMAERGSRTTEWPKH